MSVKFSLIVPTYHRNEQLRECLEQLRPERQNLPPELYEVIVTDDGEITTAEALIQECFPTFRWVKGPGTGPPANRNHGARFAKGEWLIFTDDDCLPSPDFIGGYQAGIEPGTLAYEGKIICSETIRSPFYSSPVNLTGGCFWTSNIMVHRPLFAELQGFDEGFVSTGNEDTDFRERIKHLGHKMKFVPEALVDHPPRRSRIGQAAGRMHESEIRMWYKTGNQTSGNISKRIVKNILWQSFHRARRYPFSGDTILYFGHALVELIYTLRYLKDWHQKYRDSFVGVPAPYSYPYMH